MPEPAAGLAGAAPGGDPAPVFLATLFLHGDGVGEAGISRGYGILEVVEAAQDVVVPARGEYETQHFGLDDFAGAMGAEQAVNQQEFAASALRFARFAGASGTEALVLQQGLDGGDGGVKRTVSGVAAIPRRGARPSERSSTKV